MTCPSPIREAEVPSASALDDTHLGRATRFASLRWFGLMTAFYLILLILIFRSDVVPWSDSGGYENIFRSYLHTGKVDYMQWSMPTLLGMFPLAMLASDVTGGPHSATLQSLGILYAVVTAAVVYHFCRYRSSAASAAFTAICLFCFGEFVLNAPTFMTDVPYTLFLALFVTCCYALELRWAATAGPMKRSAVGAALWLVAGTSLALAALLRTFAFGVLPLIIVAMLWRLRRRRDEQHTPSSVRNPLQFYGTMLAVCISAAAVDSLLLKRVGVHPFPSSGITVIPDVLHHHWDRLNTKASGIYLAQTVAMATPVLICSRAAQRPRVRPGEAVAGVLTFLVALAVWYHRHILGSGLSADVPDLLPYGWWCGFLQVLLMPIGLVALWRIGVHSWRSYAANPERAGFLTVVLLFGVLAEHTIATMIMPAPFLRHYVPVFAVLLMIASLSGIELKGTMRVPTAVAVALVLIATNVVFTLGIRRLVAAEWSESRRLRVAGVPEDQMDGGFGWFVGTRMRPELYDPRHPGAQWSERQHAPYLVRFTSAGEPVPTTTLPDDRPCQEMPGWRTHVPTVIGTLDITTLRCGTAAAVSAPPP